MPVLLIALAAAAGYAGYVWWRKENPVMAAAIDSGRTKRFTPAVGTGAESDGPDQGENACGCHPHGRQGGRRR